MTVSDARVSGEGVSGESAGDCAGDAPTEISTIGDGGCRASPCLLGSSVVGGPIEPEGITPVSGVPSVGSVVIGVGGAAGRTSANDCAVTLVGCPWQSAGTAVESFDLFSTVVVFDGKVALPAAGVAESAFTSG